MKILNLIKIILLSTILFPYLIASAQFFEFQKFKKACEKKNDAEACFKAGEIYLSNKDVTPDARLKETAGWYKKGCELGHVKSCAGLFDLAKVDNATYGWAALKAADLIEVNDKVTKADWYAAACYFDETRGCETNCTLGGWSKEKSKEKDYRTDGCMKMAEFAGKKPPSNEVISEQIKWWIKACNNGTMDGCANAGFNTKDPTESSRLLNLACDKKNPRACYVLGFKAREKGELKVAEHFYELACAVNYEYSCGSLSEIQKEITEIKAIAKKWLSKAKLSPILSKLKAACDGGDLNECIKYGETMEAPVDQKIPWFKKACDGGYMDGCLQMGEGFQELGKINDALDLFIKACNGGYHNGCNSAGWLCANQLKKPADAKKYYVMGCNLNHSYACDALGSLESKKGNNAEAAKYYAKACDGGNKTGCNNLASLQIDWNSITEARKYLNEACDSGSNAACQKLVALTKEFK